MASRCGCGSAVCACLINAGAGITVTGTGSPANPYVVSATGGGGGGCTTVTTTIAGLVALRDAAALDPCTNYVVTDWTTGVGTSLPGPNFLYARALDTNTLATDVLVETHIPSASFGPDRGRFIWDAGLMVEMSDPLGNYIEELGAGTIAAFPWGNIAFVGNKLQNVVFIGGYAEMSTYTGSFTLNKMTSTQLNFSTYAGQNVVFSGNQIGPGVSIVVGSSPLQLSFCQIDGSGGVQLTITNASTDPTPLSGFALNLIGCQITGNSPIAVGGTASLRIQSTEIHQTEMNVINQASLSILTSSFKDAVISQNVVDATGAIVNEITDCTFDHATVTIDGTVSASRRVLSNVRVLDGSNLQLTCTTANLTTAADAVTVERNSVLRISGDGARIGGSSVSNGFDLTTGNFIHLGVSADGGFTNVLTAANTNTGRDFAASTLV